MGVQIKEVASRRDLRTFILFPFALYRGNDNWVPPLILDEFNTLRSDKNPAFDYCEARYWLAYKDGRLAGRIAAIINPKHKEHWKQDYMRFGWIDFIDDPEVSAALLGAVEDWAAESGVAAIHGPLGFTDMDHEGMLIEGFDELATMINIYNYPYYPLHMENLGYEKDTDWVEFEIDVPPEPNPTIARIAKIALRRNKLQLLKVKNKKEMRARARELFELLCAEYKDLYSFVPLTERQMDTYTEQYLGFIDPDFVPVVVDEEDRMVAFGIIIPSLARALQKTRGRLFPFGFVQLSRAMKKNDRADLYLVAVKSEYQGKGVNAILMDQMNQVFNRIGVTKVESNPELEDNLDVQGQWKYFEKRQHKRRRCFIKYLGE